MDLNKEIKLSDLVRRPKKKAKAPGVFEAGQRQAASGAGSRRSSASRSAPPRSRPRGSSTTAPRSSCSSRGLRSRPASSSAARCATSRRSPRRSTASSPTTSFRAGASGSASAPTASACARSTSKASTTSASSATSFASSAHEALSIPLDQAVLDYHVVSETVDESGAVSRRVLLAAAYKEPIDHYVEACRAAGLELSGIDVEAFALLRAVAPA